MRCGRARQSISARVDGELDECRTAALDAHLAGCATCRAFASNVEGLAAKLDAFDAPEPRWGFTERVMARLPNRETPIEASSGWVGKLRPVPVGLGVAAFSFGVMLTVLANGSSLVDNATGDADLRVIAGDYFETVSADAVDEQLLALLTETGD